MTGKTFRSASAHLIPNLGESELKGPAGGHRTALNSQVANITKPLASTSEMAHGTNLIIMHNLGCMIKRVNASTESDILNYIKNIEGEIIPATRRGGASVTDVEVEEKNDIDEDGFVMPPAEGPQKRITR